MNLIIAISFSQSAYHSCAYEHIVQRKKINNLAVTMVVIRILSEVTYCKQNLHCPRRNTVNAGKKRLERCL